jgi:hypothetical protein
MDDYTVSSLTESKNEWVVRLVNILTPLVNEGFLSIFKESEKLCQDNDEYDKYLMTFQNFLSRVPKWNNEIIKKESQRIVEKSQCQYLDELITCVHIIHLKLLTSIRAGNNQKKIDIDIPQLEPFIHKIYITCARKLYSVVFLYEQNLIPLELQKNRKEVEGIIKESILETIRESIPVEKILRAYMDESTDIITTLKQENENQKISLEDESKEKKNEKIEENDKIKLESLEKDKEVVKLENTSDTKSITAPAAAPAAAAAPAPAPAAAIVDAPAAIVDAPAPVMSVNTEKLPDMNTALIVAPPPPPKHLDTTPPARHSNSISFNNTDSAIDINRQEEKIDAPKTVERLEAISNERHEQAKLDATMDDDDDETIKIFDDASIKMDVQDLTPITLNDTPDLDDIQILS